MSETELLATIHAEAFEDGERWDAAAMGVLLGMPGTFASVAPDGAGMAMFRVAADEAELLTIAVRRAVRRRGVASALLSVCMARCRRLGAERLFLEVSASNMPACALYRRMGFAEVGRRAAYYGDGSAALVMAAPLGPCG